MKYKGLQNRYLRLVQILANRGKIPIGTNLTFRIFYVHEELIKLVKKQNVFFPHFLNWAAIFDRMLTVTFW